MPIIENDFDVCSSLVIDEYQKAIEFIIKYNTAYAVKNIGLPQPDSSIWDLKYEICARQKHIKERKGLPSSYIQERQIELRKKVLLKHLLFKYKNIPII